MIKKDKSAFLRDVILPAFEQNERRRDALRAACSKRGWTYVKDYPGPALWQAMVSVGVGGSHYWGIKAEVPHTTPRDELGDAVQSALVEAIGRFEI